MNSENWYFTTFVEKLKLHKTEKYLALPTWNTTLIFILCYLLFDVAKRQSAVWNNSPPHSVTITLNIPFE
jgi:hypothetical protein